MSKIFLPLLLFTSALLCSATDISQVAVDVRGGKLVIDLVLSDVQVPNQSFDPSLFSVRDAPSGKELRIVSADGGAPTTIELVFAADVAINEGDELLITVKPLMIGGTRRKITSKVYPVPATAKGSAAPRLQAADGKDDSRFYFDGEISHARTEDVIGTYDLKVTYEFRKRFLNTILYDGPLFTLQGGNDPKGDPDSMQLGWNFSMPLVRSQTPSVFLALAWENTPQIESTRDFNYTNFIWSSRFRLISRAWTSTTGARIYFRPYAGAEVGRNLATNVPATKDQTVLRPFAGSTMALVVPLGGASINLTGEYIRRWPLENEVLITTDKNGKLLTPSVGTKPRDHVKASLGINFTKFAGLSVSYERGSLPPAFGFVDNKLTLGLVIKVR